ncbi:TetR-like C-terminal domain-containing protein [Saccharibacillus sp. CPCC 101409]|uniref:TetR/AcrR family transcriptional regulator n=1 Tax=Saccharibacillus sp. CPCC 101409 TaxID=3058041 RepID=UPI002671D029|nr:TetR/AcrR family transcriptional regulator [Saccharibacillus sp. CPCC 101409]MDO3413259.1 TetR-like C-terminal domain-containing protein [Saccharibacillus sp. CPCC 101409]
MTQSDKTKIDPRVLRTRSLLKHALIDLLQETEVDKITVNRIAERATINRVTFYLHYRDIQDMLEKMAEEMVVDIERALTRKVQEKKKGSEDVILLGLLEHIAENADFYKVVIGSRRVPIFHERLRDVFVRKIGDGAAQNNLSRHGVQKDVATWFGSSALIGTIASWLHHDMPYSPQFLARQFALLFRVQGLRAEDQEEGEYP